MLNSDDLTNLRATINNEFVPINDVSVVITRNGAALAAQTVRVALASAGGNRQQNPNTVASNVQLYVHGAINLDIQPEDTFVYEGALVRIKSVLPNRTILTTATAVYEH